MNKSKQNNSSNPKQIAMNKVRIDKWLWAARFFKTRAQAKSALEGGKVQLNGQRPKASKEITVNMTLQIRQGYDEKTVIVVALSDQRRSATEAALLYAETEHSIRKREESAAARKTFRGEHLLSQHRPNKKQRRQIHRFKEQGNFDL